jgi:hypothetical protein
MCNTIGDKVDKPNAATEKQKEILLQKSFN